MFVASSAIADPFPSEKPVICEDYDVVTAALAEKYHEKMVWMGKDIKNGNVHFLTVNEKEGSWTYVETDGKTACILGAGTKSTITFGEKV
jgi:hypothetical protein